MPKFWNLSANPEEDVLDIKVHGDIVSDSSWFFGSEDDVVCRDFIKALEHYKNAKIINVSINEDSKISSKEDDEVLLGKLMMTVKEATKKLGIKSYKTLINTGKEAGQEVFHLHIHILSGKMHF